MGTKLVIYSLIASYFFSCLALAQTSEAKSYLLKAGDTVVVYGDSITEQNLYNKCVEKYTVTRFPGMRVHFFGAGVGGDRVSGGVGGTVDERLSRDVFSHKPSVVAIMLGMNDGSYQTTTEAIESAYRNGYAHLIESMQSHLPQAQITLLGPSPMDDVTRAAWFPGGYNSVLEHFAELDEQLSIKYHASFVNFNPPVVALLKRAQSFDPQVAQLLIPDRVHPDTVVHWVMAETLLRAWHAPSLVSSVKIDASTGKTVEVRNASVSDLQLSREHDRDTLQWTELENSLPLPLASDNASQALLLRLSDIEQQLNQERFQIIGLKPGLYTLKIDDQEIGKFSSETLSQGLNLVDYDTPMRAQAQRVGWLVDDRNQAHTTHMRMFIRKWDLGNQPGHADLLDAFEDSLEDAIYEAAAPKPHAFSLKTEGAS